MCLFRVSVIKHQQRVEVAVPGVSHIPDKDVVLLGDFADFTQHGHQFIPWYGGVLDPVGVFDSGDSTESAASTSPQPLPLGSGLSLLYLAGFICPANRHDFFCRAWQTFFQPVQLNEKKSFGIHRIANVETGFNHPDGGIVQ